MRVAKEALAGPGGAARYGSASKVRYHLAIALARLHRFPEAEPIYRQAISEISTENDFDATARVLGSFGSDCLDAGRLDEAAAALNEALQLVRLHHLDAAANILRALAELKARQGDARGAAELFEAAIQAPQSITPRWLIYADRGEFRLGRDDLRGALADFREARRIAAQMRADIVPADQDRIALESGLSRVAGGLIDAGNRLGRQTSDPALLRETFDAAGQDRLWSLRALDPAPDDWRTRLPATYWDLLARYQTIERSIMAKPTPELARRASSLQIELEHMEAAAGNQSQGAKSDASGPESALAHARRLLDPDTVLLSFHVAATGGWLWAVDRKGVDAYPIPGLATLKATATEFAAATQKGDPQAIPLGRSLYEVLFGQVPGRYLSAKRWLLELDGPLYEVPFGALVADFANRTNQPIFLLQRAVLQTIPGALMLKARKPLGDGRFLGVGDPIYNAADARYRGRRGNQAVVLPRLPSTAGELEACARAWNPAKSRILTGADAGLGGVREALRSSPSIIHFATHVVTAPGDYSSGLIALSLDPSGAMGFLGPAEIVAHPVSPALIVMNGCHSAQGDALPGAGLMGLTRAWIGAGARSVVATRWDIPDEAGAVMMVEFYRTLRAFPGSGPAFALQQAQLAYLNDEVARGGTPAKALAVGSAYFVLGRE
jgi:hypothetical protein